MFLTELIADCSRTYWLSLLIYGGGNNTGVTHCGEMGSVTNWGSGDVGSNPLSAMGVCVCAELALVHSLVSLTCYSASRHGNC